jgi:hypothetical protein
MRLVIDLDLDRLPNDRAKEAVRILRYWAGWLPQMDLTRPTEQALMDSDYKAVGTLRLLEENAEDGPEASR